MRSKGFEKLGLPKRDHLWLFQHGGGDSHADSDHNILASVPDSVNCTPKREVLRIMKTSVWDYLRLCTNDGNKKVLGSSAYLVITFWHGSIPRPGQGAGRTGDSKIRRKQTSFVKGFVEFPPWRRMRILCWCCLLVQCVRVAGSPGCWFTHVVRNTKVFNTLLHFVGIHELELEN